MMLGIYYARSQVFVRAREEIQLHINRVVLLQ